MTGLQYIHINARPQRTETYTNKQYNRTFRYAKSVSATPSCEHNTFTAILVYTYVCELI